MSELNVHIVELPPMTVASSRAFGKSPEDLAWQQLRAWAQPKGLLTDLARHPVFGFNNPAPAAGHQDYGYEFWIAVDPAEKPCGPIHINRFDGGLFAVTDCTLASICARWKDLWEWVQASEFHCRRAHELEKHLNPLSPPEELQLELHLPIDAVKTVHGRSRFWRDAITRKNSHLVPEAHWLTNPFLYGVLRGGMQGQSDNATTWKLAAVLVMGAGMFALTFWHVEPLNGPWYWQWPWRNLPAGRVIGLLGAASVPALVAVGFAGRRWLPNWGAILLLMIGSLSMRLAGAAVLSDPMSLDFVRRATVDQLIGSYWTSAAALANYPEVLPIYHEALPHLAFHAVNKPPGPTMYHLAFIRAMGYGNAAALWSGMGLGILATFSIPATFAFIKCVTSNARAALAASAWLALSPGFLLFFPMTDPVYPVFTCLLSIFWFKALRDNRWFWSALFGLGLFATTFFTYSVLVLGVFFAGMILIVPARDDIWKQLACGFKHSVIGLSTCIGGYILLWAFTSFRPVVTFFAAYKAQADLISTSPRSHIFPLTVPWDLYDFVLGTGWIVLLIISYWLSRRDFKSVTGKIVLLAMLQILVTAGTGLLQAETARVWNFLYPLLLLPVGLELATWPRWKAAVVLTCVIALTMVVHINMTFINEG